MPWRMKHKKYKSYMNLEMRNIKVLTKMDLLMGKR